MVSAQSLSRAVGVLPTRRTVLHLGLSYDWQLLLPAMVVAAAGTRSASRPKVLRPVPLALARARPLALQLEDECMQHGSWLTKGLLASLRPQLSRN